LPKDHLLIKGEDQRWHYLGITHPETSPANYHDVACLLFHAVAPYGIKGKYETAVIQEGGSTKR
jgi:hypothetical protein